MKILFIDPPRLLLRNVRTSRVKEPDIGLAYLSSSLKKHGHQVETIDAFAESLNFDEIDQRIRKFDPDVIGLTTFTFKIFEAGEIAKRAKKWKPGVHIITGGAHASAIPVNMLEEFSSFDIAVIGEGEETTCELADKLAAGRSLEDVKGIAWRNANGITRNPGRPAISNLDSLPFPDWGAFKLELYFPIYSASRTFLELPISTARGCTGRCSFCFRLTKGFIRARSAGNVVAEIENDIGEFNAKSLIMMDETFTAEPERTHRLCDAMIAARIPGRLHWLAQTRCDKADLELFRHMKEAGCIHISFGVESGCQETLDKNGKMITTEQARNAIILGKKAGLQVDSYYILGLPYETRESLLCTRRFALKSKADFANFFVMVPYPGTLAMKLAREGKANMRLLTEDWSLYGIQIGKAAELTNIPRSEIERFQFITYLMFYLRPSKWKNLIRMVSFKAVPIYLYYIIKGIFRKK